MKKKAKPSPKPRYTAASNAVVKAFEKSFCGKDIFFQFLDMFPIPIEIFAPDGTAVFLNKALMKTNNIQDSSLVVGKYNLLQDPVCNDQMGFRDRIQKVFRGEAFSAFDVSAPIDDLADRGVIDKKPYDASVTDWYLFPLFKGKKLVFVVFVCVVKKLFQGRKEIISAEKYMNQNWKTDFDLKKIAEEVNMSPYHFSRLFKRTTGITPYTYYKQIKINKLKETLCDPALSITEAFSACGLDMHGRYLQFFKEFTGMSPLQYRKKKFRTKPHT